MINIRMTYRSLLIASSLCLTFCIGLTEAWTMSSAVSSFGGSVLFLDRPMMTTTTTTTTRKASNYISMKKGKPNLPPQMRGQYAKQQEMQAMREKMIANSTPGADGLPVFNLFVRTKKANMWYPCGSFKGDDRSRALAENYANNGLLAGISKKQIDGGIAGSLFRDKDKLVESICRGYPQLRKSRDEFEFGYKLAYKGLSEEQANEIKFIEPKEPKGLVDGIKNLFT